MLLLPKFSSISILKTSNEEWERAIVVVYVLVHEYIYIYIYMYARTHACTHRQPLASHIYTSPKLQLLADDDEQTPTWLDKVLEKKKSPPAAADSFVCLSACSSGVGPAAAHCS